MSARSDAVQQQINEMRGSAQAIRKGIEKTTEQAADWQRKANDARKLVAVLEEKARIWDALADALDSGELHEIAAPLGTGHDDRPTNAEIHAVQGRLMAELPKLDAWNIHCGVLTAMLHKSAGGSRRAILGIADRYGIDYVEDDRGEQVYMAAEGEIDDIPVNIWCLLPADDEQPVEHVDYDEAEDVREIEREMAIEAGDDSEIDQQVAEDDARAERWAEENAANQYDDEHYNADNNEDEDGDEPVVQQDSIWSDPAVRRAVRETIAESEA